MLTKRGYSAFDGVAGRGRQHGRRIHIIQLLRDSKKPLTVEAVAAHVGVTVASARYQLEALVDAGFAVRHTEDRSTPGRPRAVYSDRMPDFAHERGQGYRLLVTQLGTAIGKSGHDCAAWMHEVGSEWGRTQPATHPQSQSETDILARLLDVMQAMAFAPDDADGQPSHITLHHCPFMTAAIGHPHAFCQLHAGMINGFLQEAGSEYSLVHLRTAPPEHRCRGLLRKTEPPDQVELDVVTSPKLAHYMAEPDRETIEPGPDDM